MVNILKPQNEIWECWIFIECQENRLLLSKTLDDTYTILNGFVNDNESSSDAVLRMIRSKYDSSALTIKQVLDFTLEGVHKYIFVCKNLKKSFTIDESADIWEDLWHINNYSLDTNFKIILNRYKGILE